MCESTSELAPFFNPFTQGQKSQDFYLAVRGFLFMGKLKSIKRRARQETLLQEYFSHQVRDFYEEKQVGDKWYVKQYNGNQDKWQVAIYSNESFRKYKQYTNG